MLLCVAVVWDTDDGSWLVDAAVDAVVEAVVDSATVVDSVVGAVASTVDEVEDTAAVVVVDSVVGSVDSLVEDVSPGSPSNYAKVFRSKPGLMLSF